MCAALVMRRCIPARAAFRGGRQRRRQLLPCHCGGVCARGRQVAELRALQPGPQQPGTGSCSHLECHSGHCGCRCCMNLNAKLDGIYLYHHIVSCLFVPLHRSVASCVSAVMKSSSVPILWRPNHIEWNLCPVTSKKYQMDQANAIFSYSCKVDWIAVPWTDSMGSTKNPC